MSNLSNKQTKPRMIEWVNHLSLVLFKSWQKVNICREGLVYEKRIPHMTLILFKCVPAVQRDFINIFSTSCLLNITARFSWQVPFTRHIPEPERVSCHVGLPFLSPDTRTAANGKCSFLGIVYRMMCFFKVRASTHFTLHSWARMPVTGNLQRGRLSLAGGWRLGIESSSKSHICWLAREGTHVRAGD